MLYTFFDCSPAKRKLAQVASASLALALFMHVATPPAEAQSERRSTQQKSQKRSAQPAKPISVSGPMTALVSLNQQRMYVYDAQGFVVQTRVSSGRTGHETPKGIYSILEKKVHHESNIYLGAKMPHMQRLTMTGIALHGGVIPGYPASGGCVRLPFDFARRFFDVTSINQRVVIAPDVYAPITFSHPKLFSALPSVASLEKPLTTGTVGSIGSDVAETLLGVSAAHAATEPSGRTLESAAEARTKERIALVDAIAEAVERRSEAAEEDKASQTALGEARAQAKSAGGKAQSLARAASKAKGSLVSRQRALKTLEDRLAREERRMRADRVEALRAQVDEARADVAEATKAADAAEADADQAATESKTAQDAVSKAQERVKTAKAEVKDAAGAESEAKKAVDRFDRAEANRAEPVSVFVSSTSGMLSIRQGFESVLEMQVEIENPEVPLDTFLFTAIGWTDDSRTQIRWTAAEVDENEGAGPTYRNKKSKVQEVGLPQETDAARAARTLERIRFPKEAVDRIAEVVKPGSTLIVSSYDTAKSEMRYRGTDFIVQMPEVVAKITRPTPRPRPVETFAETGGGGFFFFGSPPPPKQRRQRRVGSSRGVW